MKRRVKLVAQTTFVLFSILAHVLFPNHSSAADSQDTFKFILTPSYPPYASSFTINQLDPLVPSGFVTSPKSSTLWGFAHETQVVNGVIRNKPYVFSIFKCSGATDPRCQDFYIANIVMLQCEKDATYCIDSIKINGRQLTFLIASGSDSWNSQESPLKIRGGTTSIWKDQEGNLFGISFTAGFRKQEENPNDEIFKGVGLTIQQLVAVSSGKDPVLQDSSAIKDSSQNFMWIDDPLLSLRLGKDDYQKAITQRVENLSAEIDLKLSVQPPPSQWINGSLRDSVSQFKKIGNYYHLLISGSALSIPIAYQEYSQAEVNSSNESSFFRVPGLQVLSSEASLGLTPTFTYRYYQSFNAIREFKTLFSTRIWNIQLSSVPKNLFCDSTKSAIFGQVQSNSTIYSQGIPNILGSKMNFMLGSPHLDENGDLNRGVYEFSMKEEVLKCMYRLKNAPIYAEVSITDEKGFKKIATINSGSSNGNYSIAIKNFTYSTPVISLTFKNVDGTKTITCIKGRLTREISGLNPKCPSGYKAKK